MRIKRFSALQLGIFLAVGALLIKVYQHNRLVYLTHTHQQLSRQHAELMHECMQLRAQKQRIASLDHIIDEATEKHGMQPLKLSCVVPLRSVLKKGD